MPVYAQYTVKCGGACKGWLVEGRPMISHCIATKYPTSGAARAGAVRAGWGNDQVCPPCRKEASDG